MLAGTPGDLALYGSLGIIARLAFDARVLN